MAIERMILEKGDHSVQVISSSQISAKDRRNVRVNVHHEADDEILADVRRYPDEYRISSSAS